MSDIAAGGFASNESQRRAKETAERATDTVPVSTSWLRKRVVWLSIWAIAVFLTLVAALIWHAFEAPILQSYSAKALFVASTTLLWLPLILMFLDAPDNLSKGPAPTLPLITLAIMATLTALAVADNLDGPHFLVGSTLNADMSRVAFFAFLTLVFIPNIWSAANFAAYDDLRRRRATRVQEQVSEREEEAKDAEAMGALVATAVVIGIGLLAYIAGGDGGSLSIRQIYGLVLGVAVIGIFAVVVFLGSLADTPVVRWLSNASRAVSHAARPIADIYNWIDEGLVRIGASVVGMGHVSPWMRYTLLLGFLGSLSVMSWYLPPPWGLIVAFLGFVLAFSISRLWSWVEDDRALAAMTEYRASAPYRVGFREDFRDESLVGLIFIFLLIPAAMMQAHNSGIFGPHLFRNADEKSFVDWFAFFGVELSKAVPIVDWAEVYGVHATDDMIGINGPASMHAIFLVRVTIDLLLIAGLLQALAVATRNRQQKQLYAARHINRLDLFVEQTELWRAIRAAHPNGSTSFNLAVMRESGLVDFRRYNEDRLRQIYGSTSDPLVRGFIESIANAKMRPDILISAIELTIEIAQGSRNEFDLVQAFQRALAEHSDDTKKIDAGDLYVILSELRSQSGLRDFKSRVADRMVGLGQDADAIDFLLGLAAGEKADAFLYGRDIMVSAIGRIASEMSDLAFLRDLHGRLQVTASERISPRVEASRAAIDIVEARIAQLSGG